MHLKKIIISGGSGFIGDYVSHFFVNRGFEYPKLIQALHHLLG